MGRCSSLHRGCMGGDSSGRVVKVLAWCIAHVQHTRVNTSVGSMYFFDFQHIKPMYMYNVFKTYMLYKRTLVVFDLILARWDSESVFDRPWILLLSLVLTPQTIFMKWFHMWLILHIVYYVLCIICDVNLSSSSTRLCIPFIYFHSSFI